MDKVKWKNVNTYKGFGDMVTGVTGYMGVHHTILSTSNYAWKFL